MVNVLHVFILLMCSVFTNSRNIGLLNYSQLLNYEIDDIKLVDETSCPQPKPCYIPLKYDVQYRCRSDVTCPRGLKCCRDDCYIHNVCVQPLHVNKLQIFEFPAENSSLANTLSFDISNATLLERVKVKLSANLTKILANESGQVSFNAPDSLISLASILPFLKISTSLDNSDTILAENYSTVVKPLEKLEENSLFNETAEESGEEFERNYYEIFEPKPLTENYESTTKKPTDLLNNEVINIDDDIIERNLESDKQMFDNKSLATTTIRTTDSEKKKQSRHHFIKNHNQIKRIPNKNIKAVFIENIKKNIKDIGGFEDDADYFEGSGHGDDVVSSTPYYVKKEYDGSGDYNEKIDEKTKYEEGSGDITETSDISLIISSTGKNFVTKEYDNDKEIDEENKYDEGSGDNIESHTTSAVISSTGKNYVMKEYGGIIRDNDIEIDEKNKYDDESGNNKETTSIISSTDKNYVTIKDDNIGGYKKETDELGSGDNETTHTTSSVISSTGKEVENKEHKGHKHFKNIKGVIINIKNINRVIKTSKNHIDEFEDDVDYSEGSGDDDNVMGSGDFHKENKNTGVIALVNLINGKKLFRHAAHYWKQFGKFRGEVEESGSSEIVETTSPTTSFVNEYSAVSSNTEDGYSTTEITTISSTTSLEISSVMEVSKPNQFIGLNDDYYYDTQDDETTTISNEIPFTPNSRITTTISSLEDSESISDFIDIDNDTTTLSTMLTTQDIHSKTTLEGSGNNDDEIVSSGQFGDYYDYEGSGDSDELGSGSSETSRIDDKMIFSKTESPKNLNSTPPVQNETIDLVNTFKEYTLTVTTAVTASTSESVKEYALPENHHENQKEIQKESSVSNNIVKNYKEESFKKPDYSKDVRAAKAALDMMKESTGNEPDDYYEY